MQRKRRTTTAFLSLGMLVASSCGGGSDAADNSTSPSGTVASERFAIADFLGGASERDPVAHAEREQFTADCMADLGFRYVPEVFDSGPRIATDSRELRDAQGFGVTLDAPSEAPTGPAAPQPNREYVDSLNVQERNLWIAALTGPVDPPPLFLKDAGCSGAAAARYLPNTAKIDQLNVLLDQLNNTILSDPELRELEAAYQVCMSELGYPNVTTNSLVEGFVAAAQPLYDAGDQDGLTRLAVDERNAALADWGCTDREAQLDRTADIERAFFETHQAEFLDIMQGQILAPDD